MRGIGKISTGKSPRAMSKPLLTMAFLSASAAFALLPTEASAQFNIDGIIRGAIGPQRGYGYRQSSHHSSHHESSDKSRDSDQDAADSKTGKGIKSGNDDNSGDHNAHGSGDSQSAASNTPPPKTGPSGSGSPAPKSSDSDVPAFAPSR
jgi:hypothetical protein